MQFCVGITNVNCEGRCDVFETKQQAEKEALTCYASLTSKLARKIAYFTNFLLGIYKAFTYIIQEQNIHLFNE